MAVIDGKLTMSMLQTVNAIQAVVLTNFMIPSDHGLSNDIGAANASHGEKAYGIKGHTLGLTDLWVWHAPCTHVLNRLKASPPQLTEAQTEFLKKFDEHVTTSTPSTLSGLVQHAYLVKPNYYKPEVQRLELGICNTLILVMDLLTVYIQSIGGRKLEGKAPRGELEREMSKLLNDFGKGGKGKSKGKKGKKGQNGDESDESLA